MALGPTLGNTLGVMEISWIVGAVLLGINILQAYHYFCNYPGDHWSFKSVVAAVCVSNILHTILFSHSAYTYTVINFGTSKELSTTPAVMAVALFLTGFITFLVQAFFTFRIHAATHGSIAFALPCGLLTLICFAFVAACMVESIVVPVYSQFLDRFRWLFLVTSFSEATNDFIITCILCMSLSQNRNGMEWTEDIIDKIFAFTIGTGIINSMASLAAAISFVFTASTFIWLGIYMVSPKILSISLLVSLNSRKALREELNDRIARQLIARPNPHAAPLRIQMETITTRYDSDSLVPDSLVPIGPNAGEFIGDRLKEAHWTV